VWLPRKGAAAFELSWNGSSWQAALLGWNADLLETQNSDEEVRALMYGSATMTGQPGERLWIAGRYSGPPKPHLGRYSMP
jgi:hypothetical protein